MDQRNRKAYVTHHYKCRYIKGIYRPTHVVICTYRVGGESAREREREGGSRVES